MPSICSTGKPSHMLGSAKDNQGSALTLLIWCFGALVLLLCVCPDVSPFTHPEAVDGAWSGRAAEGALDHALNGARIDLCATQQHQHVAGPVVGSKQLALEGLRTHSTRAPQSTLNSIIYMLACKHTFSHAKGMCKKAAYMQFHSRHSEPGSRSRASHARVQWQPGCWPR